MCRSHIDLFYIKILGADLTCIRFILPQTMLYLSI